MTTIYNCYTIWSEWDIGEEGYVYTSKWLAEKALDENLVIKEILVSEDVESWRVLEERGLITINTGTLIDDDEY